MNLKHAKDTVFYRYERKCVSLLKSGLASMLAMLIVLSVIFSVNWYQGVSAYDDPTSLSQTRYEDVSEFQKYRWVDIQKEIFKPKRSGVEEISINNSNPQVVSPQSICDDYVVKSGNKFFNWVNTGLDTWSGNKEAVFAKSTNENYKYGDVSAKYYVFDVDTPAKFRYVIEHFAYKSSSNVLRVLSNRGTKLDAKNTFIKINITADLDMGGQNGAEWKPVALFNETKDNFDYRRYMYIEGNGHTIYNLKIVADDSSTEACGLMASAPPFMTIKNLGFMSSMLLNCQKPGSSGSGDDYMQTALICAYTPQKMYLYNVHSSGGYYQNFDSPNLSATESREFLGGIGGLVGRKNCPVIPHSEADPLDDVDIGDTFFENCSTEKSYAYAENHVGGFSSFMCTKAYADEYTYGDKIPATPEQYVFDLSSKNSDEDYTAKTQKYLRENSSSYPIMLQNCSSTDCELFSVGNDSGAFISCGTGHAVEGCFTNNTLYSRENSGGFIGRVDSTKTPMIKDSTGSYKLSSVFKDCYSSGVIEGKFAMGGFTGLDNSWRWRTTIYEKATSRSGATGTYITDWGATVYENCYSTAMVGMDYAGKYAGGFVGLDDNYNSSATITADGKTFKGKGSFYINCYSAGEVGNILTTTDTDDPNTLELEKKYFNSYEGKDNKTDILDYYPTGGFAGVVGLDAYIYARAHNGSYYNNPTGTFHNCYYDVQTSAMHEMAVGLSSTKSRFTVDGVTTNVTNNNYSMTGITGLYTEDCPHKHMDGLTDMKKMSNGENVWRYTDEYYPQLNRYMISDIDYSDISDTTYKNLENLTASEFYIEKSNKTPTTNDERNEYSVPVLSLGGAMNENSSAAQMAQIVRAYRVSQASTATVLLDHWDIVMDPDSGLIGNEQTAWLPESRNKLTQHYVDLETGNIVANVRYYAGNNVEVDTAAGATRIDIVNPDNPNDVYARIEFRNENGSIKSIYTDMSTGRTVAKLTDVAKLRNTVDEWRKTYSNLDANTKAYQFKIEQGEGAVNFNYGIGGYNGGNMQLSVPYENSETTIRFHQSEITSTDYYVIAECYNPETNTTTVDIIAKGTGASIPGGDTYLYLRGDFNNFGTDDLFKYDRIDENGHTIYQCTYPNMPAGDHIFKVGAVNWDNGDYGYNGESAEDMRFTLSKQADVTFEFNLNNKHTSVLVEDESILSNTYLYKPLYLRGSFNNWGDTEADLANAEMTYDGNYVYTYVYTDLAKGSYEFKVGTSDWFEGYGIDGGSNNMSIKLSDKATVTFTFNYQTKLTSVTVDPKENLEANNTTSNSNITKKTLYVRGSFNGYGKNAKMYTDDNIIFTKTVNLTTAKAYDFFIADAKENSAKEYNESYGFDGGSENMTFTTNQATSVTFTFNYNTKITTISANPSDALTEVNTFTAPFEGISVITSRDITDKYDWDEESASSREASEDGQLVDEKLVGDKLVKDGWYEKTFTVDVSDSSKYNKVYGYKIIRNQNTATRRRYFYLNAPVTAGDTKIKVTFHYNEETDEAFVTTDDAPYKSGTHQYPYAVKGYHVAGNKEFTGCDWLGDGYNGSGAMALDNTSKKYIKTFENVPAGDHEFKVVAEANWNLGIHFGDQYDNNYKFRLNQTADVTVVLNDKSGIVTVSANPIEAIDQKQYQLSGTSNLTKDTISWSKNHNMVFDDNIGSYSITFNDVPCDENVMYRITEKGGAYNNKFKFYLDSEKYMLQAGKPIRKVDIRVDFDGNTSKVIIFNDDGEAITNLIKSNYRILSYSVLGDEHLTGYDWGVDKTTDGEAKKAGEMEQFIPVKTEYNGFSIAGPEGVDCTYWKKDFDVKAPKNGETYAFKIAANGTWESDVTYGEGGLNGGNVIVTVASPSFGEETCKISVIFRTYEENGATVADIFCVDENGYIVELNYDTFDWYVIGTRELTSLESKISNVLVYDTVRDITGKFRFTSGVEGEDRGITWATNKGLNESYDFKDDMYFSLDYSVEKVDSTTTFDSKIVDMDAEVIKNEEVTDLDSREALNVKQFVEEFAPGKQWITVSTTGYGYAKAYTLWKKNMLEYTKYRENREELKKIKDLYVSALKGYKLNGVTVSKDNIVQYCQYLTRNNAHEDLKALYEELSKAYGDLLSVSSLMPSDSELTQIINLLSFDSCLEQCASEESQIVGKRNLRLIPTAYIEAGVDASVSVAQADEDGTDENIDGSLGNLVRYENDTVDEYVNVNNTNGGDVDSTNYDKYNLAYTAGYLVTDRIGLGIYNNYKNQGGTKETRDRGIKKYSQTEIRDDLLSGSRKVNQYFAMSSVFTMAEKYYDNRSTDNYKPAVDVLKQQTVIGPAYDRKDSADQTSTGKQAQTIAKVFKINPDGSEEKVLMDPSADGSGVYSDNYKKWTAGDKLFTHDDIGKYVVRMYWAMSDGRYLVDEKYVVVRAITSSLTKAVDPDYTTKTKSGETREITYKLTYSNGPSEEAVNFAILDILPFKGDIRLNALYNTTIQDNCQMKLKSVTLQSYSGAHIQDLKYTTSENVRTYMTTGSQNTARTDSAKELNLTTGDGLAKIGNTDDQWKSISSINPETNRYDNKTYTISGQDASSITAISLAGRMLTPNQKITVTFVIETSNLYLQDYLVNNGYYDVISVEGDGVRRSGISNPVGTAVIGRDITGKVWLDYNSEDGKPDGEPVLPGVKVKLYKQNSSGRYSDTGMSTETDENGVYTFEGLEEGTYRVVFDASVDKSIKIDELETYNYKDLELSESHIEVDEEELNIGTQSGSEVIIDTRIMPWDEAVYSKTLNSVNDINGTVDEKGNYTKYNQSIALKAEKVKRDYSFDVYKTGENGEALEGVEFSLERLNGDKWEKVEAKQNYYYDDVIYLETNNNWNSDGARFAAYFFNEKDEAQWASMVETDVEGLYGVAKPDMKYTYVIFCRMNPNFSDNNWNSETEKNRVWNQTPDISLPTNGDNCYKLVEGLWEGNGIWKNYIPEAEEEEPSTPQEPEPEEAKILYLKPNSNWKQASARFAAYFFNNGNGTNTWVSMTDGDGDGLYECEIPDGSWPNVIFCRMNPSTTENNWNNKWNQTADLTLPTDDKNCYAVQEGTWDKGGGTWSTFAVTPPEEETPEPEIKKNIYLVPNHWDKDEAKFAVYFFNGTTSSAWASMTDEDGDGVYECEVPDGEWKNLIFVRMKADAEENSWSNKWNQTSDLTFPTGDNNCFEIPIGLWSDIGSGYEDECWTKYNAEESDEEVPVEEGLSIVTNKFITDSFGKIKVIGLPKGSYRLTEENAVGEFKILTSSIYFELPYTVSSSTLGTFVDVDRTVGGENNKYYLGKDKQNNSYYSHVSFHIIDPLTSFRLPVTGFQGVFITAIIGVALLAVAAMLYIASKKKKKEKATALKH